jgi:AraC family transcriptional regulator
VGAHQALEVTWVEDGHLTCWLGSSEHVMGAGAAIVVPAFVEHRNRFDGGTRSCSIHLGPEMLAEVGEAMGISAEEGRLVPGPVRRPERLVALGRMLQSESTAGAEGHLIVLQGLAEALAVEVLRGRSHGPAYLGRDRRILEVLEHMEANLDRPLALDDLARVAGLSRYHFCRLFRREVGHSPYRYLLRLRLERAAAIIRKGHVGVTEAALQAGFGDLGRFNRAFRQRFGCTPSEYRPGGRPGGRPRPKKGPGARSTR